MERGDTGLGRDAYGPPRHERDRRGYGLGPYPPDDGYPAEEDDAAELHEGDPVVVERLDGLTLSVRRAEDWELVR